MTLMMHKNVGQISDVMNYLIPSKSSIVLQAITWAILENQKQKNIKLQL